MAAHFFVNHGSEIIEFTKLDKFVELLGKFKIMTTWTHCQSFNDYRNHIFKILKGWQVGSR